MNIPSESSSSTYKICIVTPDDHRFQWLATLLEEELSGRDGENAKILAELNTAPRLDVAIIAHDNNELIGCGAWRTLPNLKAVELKRMYIIPKFRRSGFAKKILNALENSLPVESRIILETGKNQPEALAFYTKCGYQKIAAFEPYNHNTNSVCFEKVNLNRSDD